MGGTHAIAIPLHHARDMNGIMPRIPTTGRRRRRRYHRRPRTPPNERPHPRQRRRRHRHIHHSRPLHAPAPLALIRGAFILIPQPPAFRPARAFCLHLRGRMRARDEQRPESGEGNHEDGDATLQLLPEGRPDVVGACVNLADADDGDENHDSGEAEEEGDPDLLAERDGDFVD